MISIQFNERTCLGGKMKKDKDKEIPIYKKCILTIEEASAYSNIGESKLRELANDSRCTFVLYVGRKILIKRVKFEECLENEYSI